ncbi:MAG: ParB/RepB/Spo0J family partition protein [Clostridiales Family XIII bacterium]|jgi:ParB family chromosome partitioning protein|nr:ParB/RepB/Spo0J family partition protein [Clostridiales Family XIII bacterium]
MANTMKNIETSLIKAHPDNPRKELGDLTELVASIKAKGILQNLTVVADGDRDGFYTCIIGHRRLTAARLAGLSEVPCTVAELDEAQQLETMLTENMQRSDLTPIEEAHGIQMLMDLGICAEDICQATGLSETTVRRRAKLNDFDQDTLMQKYQEGATLMDFAKLEPVRDLAEKDRLLGLLGTHNFAWEFTKVMDIQAADTAQHRLMPDLQAAGLHPFPDGWDETDFGRIAMLNLAREHELPPLDGAAYWLRRGGLLIILGEMRDDTAEEAEEDPEAAAQAAAQAAAKAARAELLQRMYESRMAFVRDHPLAPQHMEPLIAHAASIMASFPQPSRRTLCDLLGLDVQQVEQGTGKSLWTCSCEQLFDLADMTDNTARLLFLLVASTDSATGPVAKAYALLSDMGYPVSDEEQAVIDEEAAK